MLIIALLVVAVLFVLLFFGRLAGARRAAVSRHWPAVLLAVFALFTLVRGGVWQALALLVIAGLVYLLRAPKAAPPPRDNAADAEARAILGVGPDATAGDIRAAYRAKMATAHPDRGGSHYEAARLTAARDRLLKRR